jgi:putative lipoprotein
MRNFRFLPLGLLVILGLTSSASAAEDPWWGQDKAQHFLVSATLSSGAYAIGTLEWQSRVPTAGVALGFTLALGAGKEGWDALGHGNASWKDFTWDIVGALAGIGLSFVVDTAVRPATSAR